MIEKNRQRFVWLFILISLSGIGYLAANAWGRAIGAISVQSVFDAFIPFVPNAIFVYLLFFIFILTPVFLIKKYDDFVMFLGIYSMLIFVSLVIFFQVPTTMERPRIPDSGLVGWLFSIIRAIDGPNNLFPSLHVSSVVLVALVNGYFCPKTKWISIMCAVLISISTLFSKQHALIDVFGGAVFGVAAYLLLRLLRRQE